MSKQYLITLSIGPIQDFIAAARRTRDLWFGSFVLSEVSKAAALTFSDSGATMIFPAEKTDLTKGSIANVSNKLLVKITTDNPKEVLEIAKKASRNRWAELADQAKRKISVEETIWHEQINDVLEFFGAWVHLEKDEDYGAASEQCLGRKRLDQLLNARKNTRQFIANPVKSHAIAKSSLDGLRESVLPNTLKSWQKRKLGLSAGEELDTIGVVKRLGDNAEQFTPLSRLAADPWLRFLENKNISLVTVETVFGELSSTPLGLVSSVRGNTPCYDFFPYDGQLLYDFRIQAELEGLKRLAKDSDEKTRGQIEDASNHLIKLREILTAPPFNAQPTPEPYMAILVADGDNMGTLLDNMNRIEDHQKISEKLSDFASNVPALIRDFNGHCVYAGGDDVLALLPLDTAIPCAKELADRFNKTLESIIDKNKMNTPTMSVGLGISHFLIPLSKQLDLARRAEQLAKSNDKPDGQSKNALAIILQPRSGAEISFRERWDNTIPPDEIFKQWIDSHNNQLLPKSVGYALREVAIALDWCQDATVIEKETSRILQRKRNPDGSFISQGLITKICQRAAQTGLSQLANELIITRRFAAAYQLTNKPDPVEIE